MRRGLAVPDQMAIWEFGAYEILDVSVPAITTTNPFPHNIGLLTVELIISVLTGGYDAQLTKTVAS